MDTTPRYVLCGLNRLTVAVAAGLRRQDPAAEIVVVAPEPDRLYGPLAHRSARLVYATDGLEAALRGEAGLVGTTCLVALADDDLDNMRAAVTSHSIAPDVPIVVRVFDRVLARHLEGLRDQGESHGLNIRRAYSLSALAAPRFVAAALGQEHVLTMRLESDEIPFFRLPVHDESPLVDRAVGAAAEASGCSVVALRPGGAPGWLPSDDASTVLRAGDEVVVAGPGDAVLRLAARSSDLFRPSGVGDQRRQRRSRRVQSTRTDRPVQPASPTLLPRLAVLLSAVLVASLFLIGFTWHRTPVDALYWTLTAAASGAPSDGQPLPEWVKVFAVVPIMAGGALLGVLFSQLASVATAQRLEQQFDRQVGRMRNHVVLGGLGTVGFRIERLLADLGVPTAVLDLDPQDKFTAAVSAPVFGGDVRLPENLERANIAHAACLIAATDDDLSNIEACLNARKLNPDIRTVARIFDDTLADQSHLAFGITTCLSSSRVASRAFVDAATDHLSQREFLLGDDAYLALRVPVSAPVEETDLQAWRAQGVHVAAARRSGDAEPVMAGAMLAGGLRAGDQAVVAGPAEAVRRWVVGGGRLDPVP